MKPPTSPLFRVISVVYLLHWGRACVDPPSSVPSHRTLADGGPTTLQQPTENEFIAQWSSCGNGRCDQTYLGSGETCGNCPVDCGPCQRVDDGVGCEEPMLYALSFDDGPSPATASLLDLLDAYNVKASFFVIGNRLEKYAKEFNLQRERGHRQFSHTFSHPLILSLSPRQLYDELQLTADAFQNRGCSRPVLYRPPYGQLDEVKRRVAAKFGMRAVLWNLDTLDWRYAATNPGKLVVEFESNVVRLRPRSITQIQLDLFQPNVDVTPALVRTAKAMGYQFVTLDRCLWGPNYRLHPSWVFSELRCEDTDWTSVVAERRSLPLPATANGSTGTAQCPTTDWSEWSMCDAECGHGASTRIRYSLPPSWELYHSHCSSVSFLEIRDCLVSADCPGQVWSDGNAISFVDPNTSNDTDLDLSLTTLTTCRFGDWRWPNTTGPVCSKPCGYGTHVMVRNFTGTGKYSEACGPMLRTVLCHTKPCPLPQPKRKNAVVLLGVSVGLGSVGIVLIICVVVVMRLRAKARTLRATVASLANKPGHKGPLTITGAPTRVSVNVTSPLSMSRQGSSEEIQTAPGPAGKPVYGPTPPVIEPVPVNYFSRGSIVGTFVVRNGLDNFVDPNPHIPECLVAEAQPPPSVVVFQEVTRRGVMAPKRRSIRKIMKSASQKSVAQPLAKPSVTVEERHSAAAPSTNKDAPWSEVVPVRVYPVHTDLNPGASTQKCVSQPTRTPSSVLHRIRRSTTKPRQSRDKRK